MAILDLYSEFPPPSAELLYIYVTIPTIFVFCLASLLHNWDVNRHFSC